MTYSSQLATYPEVGTCKAALKHCDLQEAAQLNQRRRERGRREKITRVSGEIPFVFQIRCFKLARSDQI